MYLIAGLGNVGALYALNRHNAGFMAADTIAASYDFAAWQAKFNALVTQGEIAGEKVMILKPTTFMNASGKAVGEAMRFYKLPLSQLIVIHDDIDLAFGKVKTKIGGGAAGHNGLKSIDEAVGADYVRVRIGVDRPARKEQVINFVTSNFPKEQLEELPFILGAVAENIPLLLCQEEKRLADFTNRFALTLQK